MERGVNNQDEDEESEVSDEDELSEIRRQRFEKFKNMIRGRIIEIPDSNGFLSVIENNSNCYVFVHIYRDGLEVSGTLNDALLQLAVRFEERAKFYKVQSNILGTSGMFVGFKIYG